MPFAGSGGTVPRNLMSITGYDFTSIPARRGTGCELHDGFGDPPDILQFWLADMELPSPPCVRQAMLELADLGTYGYAHPRPSLIQALQEHAQRHYGWEIAADWLVWLPGVAPGLHGAVRAVAGQAGDEVLVCTPVYPPFLHAPRQQGATLVTVPLRQTSTRWQLDTEALAAAITPRTRLLLWCHPHNPVGRAWDDADMAAVEDLVLRHKLILCSDEIHADLPLQPVPHRPCASRSPALAARTITLMAPSKTFNLPGLGCGYAIIPDDALRRRFRHALRGLAPMGNLAGFAACEAVLCHGEPWRQALLTHLRANHDHLLATVASDLAPLTMTPVEATYLAWLDARALKLPDPAAHFLAHGMRLGDGQYFGAPGYLRLSFACPRTHLDLAITRLRAGLQAVPRTC